MQRPGIKAFVAATIIGVGPTWAQFPNADTAILYRRGASTLQAQHFGMLGAMAIGRVPFDLQAAAIDAEALVTLSRLKFRAFTEIGIRDVANPKETTRASPEIWKQKEDWVAAVARFDKSLSELGPAIRSGQTDVFKVAVGNIGGSCKACHDTYRLR